MEHDHLTRGNRLVAAGLFVSPFLLASTIIGVGGRARGCCAGRPDGLAVDDAAEGGWHWRGHAGHPVGGRDLGVSVRRPLWPEQRLGVLWRPWCRPSRVRDSFGI